MNDEQYLIPTAVLQKVVDYLSERPFKEVNLLIAAIQQKGHVYVEPKPDPDAKGTDATEIKLNEEKGKK